MAKVEITEYDIEQGKIVYEVLKKALPHTVKQMEYMVKNLGWAGTEAFLDKKKLPKKIRELQTTALKYLHHKYQIESKEN